MFDWLFRKPAPAPEPVNPGAALAKIGKQQRRAMIRATADQIRADLRAKGIDAPPLEWPPL